MAASSGSRKRHCDKFPVGKYIALQKEKWDSILKETKSIKDADDKLAQKNKELCTKRERIKQIDAKVSCLHIEL